MSIVANVASTVVGFGSVILMFRIQRELQMRDKNETSWIAYSDWLVIVAMIMAGSLGLALPLSIRWFQLTKFPAAACSSSVILLIGYVFAILAHYRLILGRGRRGRRKNPEPAEKVLISIFGVLATDVFFSSLA
jgi:hypothetical protein